jgi:two-component system phosphate regulon sensor histidine kinase PhoR
MPPPTVAVPLARRLVDRYLMFGLACVFVCLSLSIALSHRGTFLQLAALTVVGPLVLLMVGAIVLRRTVRLNEAIEQQLCRIASASSGVAGALQPLPEPDASAIGWNRILEHLNDQRTSSALETRLASALDTADGKRWKALFNSLGEGVAVSDRNDQVLMANNALAAMLGLEHAEQAVGQKMSDLFATAIGSPMAAVLGTGGTFSSEVRRGTDLAAGVWKVSRSPVIDDDCEGTTTLWSLRDITQQKLAEEMRNQFVFTATHELRTPLANIKAYAETLATGDDIDVESQKGFYNIINNEATRLARFVDELLNVSQMEAGAVTITRHETDVARLLGEVVENVQPQVKQKELTFESHLPAKIPKLRLDKDKIAAALVNLLGNAVKYTPNKGTVRLLVEADDAQIHFHVEDTGIGIAADELPRLFEKFFRSQDARVQSITGSGLGLAFTQEVARLHGGKIAIKSEINKGSRFTLSLPLN